MPGSGHVTDDPIFAALEALHCPPDEVAHALGLDLRTLFGYQFGAGTVPRHVVHRLAELLEDRASFLRDMAALLEGGRTPRGLTPLS
jgi:hypothetical protein